MKTKALLVLLTGCLLALAAWLMDEPNPAQADEVPEKYRETVHKGLKYLARSQFKDGHWEGDGGQHPVAMTGLAGLALLMEGSTVRKGNYAGNIRKAVDWLMDKSRDDGLIFSEHASETGRYMYGHGLATLFLAGAYVSDNKNGLLERHKDLNDILTGAVKYIVNAQSTQGGWYHTSRVEGHDLAVVSATVIQIQALQAVKNAGFPVPNETNHDAQEYLKMALAKYEEGAGAGRARSRPAETAAALVCRDNSSDGNDALCKKWYQYCQNEIPVGRGIVFGRDELTHFFCAQAMFLFGHERSKYSVGGGADPWNAYRTAMFDHLQSSQNKDGSWPAGDGLSVGRLYSTAVWCTILQLDGNRHPATRRIELDVK